MLILIMNKGNPLIQAQVCHAGQGGCARLITDELVDPIHFIQPLKNEILSMVTPYYSNGDFCCF